MAGEYLLFLLLFLEPVQKALSLNNGLALTPPSLLTMLFIPSGISTQSDQQLAIHNLIVGWMNWERFRCNVDCNQDPENCISEKLFMQMADHLVEDGYKDVGYEYVSIDDCWSSKERDASGQLQPNSTRFPSGIPALSKYIHGKGLKLGMYADFGVYTCAGYPGSIEHIQQDCKTFAGWGVDYLKVDGCFSDPKQSDIGYPKFTAALNATGRPVLLCCEWPSYQEEHKIKPNYTHIAQSCNTWRNYDDVQDSWDSVLHILDYFAANQDTFVSAAGPGAWNDPDQIVVGNFGLSFEQSKAQFALWSILAAPLIMSNDLRKISPEAREILQNKEVIAVDQDKLGKMGRQVYKDSNLGFEVWSRPLAGGSVAVVLFCRRYDMPHEMEATFDIVGLHAHRASARDLFAHKDLGVYSGSFRAKVNPSGVVMVKLMPVS